MSPHDLKVPVVTLVERDGAARSQPVTDVTGTTMSTHLTDHVSAGADLMTDQSRVHRPLGPYFASRAIRKGRGKWLMDKRETAAQSDESKE